MQIAVVSKALLGREAGVHKTKEVRRGAFWRPCDLRRALYNLAAHAALCTHTLCCRLKHCDFLVLFHTLSPQILGQLPAELSAYDQGVDELAARCAAL